MSPAPPASVTVDFRAMGSAARVVVVGSDDPTFVGSSLDDLATHAHRRVEVFERRWSRFIPSSDICRLNAAGGEPVEVHPTTIDLVTHLVQAWHATHGAFDPTLLGALMGLGYVSSWEDPTRSSPVAGPIALRGNAGQIEVDAAHNVVRLPADTAIDAGGLGKGFAADVIAADLLARGAAGVLVSLGGDLRVAGVAPQGGGWAVGIDDPTDRTASIAQVRLDGGGVATSGTDRRRWQHDDRTVHHLIDPTTCEPAVHQDGAGRTIVSATVIAGTAAWAEAWTKAVMVRGHAALDEIAALGLAALVVHDDASTVATPSWSNFATVPSNDDAPSSHRTGDDR